MSTPVDCDRARIVQLASNLIANAVTHGTPNEPIVVEAYIEGDRFVLPFQMAAIPSRRPRAQAFPTLFRGGVRRSREALGLRQLIANEITKSHGGTMDVSSTQEEARFTFSMPTHPIPERLLYQVARWRLSDLK